uniref:Uncharacterized protein n=1 Tax=Lepeophtheirus salmonis TaxID=72036 RepID=A0A0K2T8D7_LEPSM
MVLLLTLNSLEMPLTVALPLLSSTYFFTAATISSDLRGLDLDLVVA